MNNEQYGRLLRPQIEKHFPEPIVLNSDTITITMLRIRWTGQKRTLEIDLIYPDEMKQSISRNLPSKEVPWIETLCSIEFKLFLENTTRSWWAKSGRANLENADFMRMVEWL